MSFRGWYPLALSRDIAPGTSTGTRVHGSEFVIWRDDKGGAHVWEDRCPHRGMKLSFGFVRGDHIACLYHGWQYDTAGQCRYIPAHPDLTVPKTIKVPRFSVAEAGGVIWGCFSEEDDDAPPAPKLPVAAAALRSIFADCPAPLLVERVGLLDVEGLTPDVSTIDDRILEVRLGGNTLIACVQPVADKESALHIVAMEELDAAQMKPLALWAEELRRDAESFARKAAIREIAA
ncbi:Rieske (2Fe-2S) protein [Mesorhizobium xinjiangense]|uniref:Rieske (2Fe-2S) protein n=1 Tax=Mesorhizobium xinjiangense TaxID=2678685 RepID=UPI0012EDD403|nr:Rieske (2Fe-2S) protein [Mesorhizobium xinjiangense]